MFKMMLLMVLAAPVTAIAATTRTQAPADRAQVRYDFDDDVVEGGVLQPDVGLIDSRRPIKHSTLIKIRQTFVPELLKSAEDL